MKEKNSCKKLGEWGENLAAGYLKGKKYKILARNFYWPGGEVDIIAQLGERIIFVEVKTSRTGYGSEFDPEWRVNWRKERQIMKTAIIFLNQHFPDQDKEWQVDVISVILKKSEGKALIKHFKNISSG